MSQPNDQWTVLAEMMAASAPGNERQVMREVADAVSPLNLPSASVERLKTAVAETTMNAMEHGNHYDANLDVRIQVAASPNAVRVRITDHGGSRSIPPTPTPDIDAKLAGQLAAGGKRRVGGKNTAQNGVNQRLAHLLLQTAARVEINV